MIDYNFKFYSDSEDIMQVVILIWFLSYFAWEYLLNWLLLYSKWHYKYKIMNMKYFWLLRNDKIIN
jgi:hypothetical protein